MRIRIRAGSSIFTGMLNDGPTAKLIAQALPLRAKASRWGQEIYFTIAVRSGLEPSARAAMAVGELGYWPDGLAFCIFFGPTPASTGAEPMAVSPVNPLGRLDEPLDVAKLNAVKSGAEVTIQKA